MAEILQGIPASPGIAIAPAYVIHWPRLDVPHAVVTPDLVETEVARFHAARQTAARRTAELRQLVEERLGPVQAKIFDPQLMMLDDPDLIEGTLTYISDSNLTAERAFSLRVLEFRARWLDATHARVMDRVADLNDVQACVLSSLIDFELPDIRHAGRDEPVILVAHELSPSGIVELERDRVLGVATDAGTRTSHASILARSLGIPSVVGLGDLTQRVQTGVEIVLDGHRGKVLIAPSDSEKHQYQDRQAHAREAAQQLGGLVGLEAETRDGARVQLLANIELPADADVAVAVNADGVGLLRTEFLVVGRTHVPEEEEQYEAFRHVIEAVAPRTVTIRTFDLGGDKFPLFLPPVTEDNPFLGWRGMRIYEMMPDLFHNQVRAVLRAAALGPVQLLVPLVNTVHEVGAVRAMMERVRDELKREGREYGDCPLGVMLETPAAVVTADLLGRHCDFFSLGTNDLVQYMLAVDRSNAQLASFFDLYHPALLRCIRQAVLGAAKVDRPLSVCGEAASDPLGALLLLGLGLRSLSCAPSAILRQKKLVRSIDLSQLERVTLGLMDAESGHDVRRAIVDTFGDVVGLANLDAGISLS